MLSTLDRAGLIHDAFKLVCERMLDPTIVLDLVQYMRKERDLIPFIMLRSKAECISTLIKDKKLKQKYLVWLLYYICASSLFFTDFKMILTCTP